MFDPCDLIESTRRGPHTWQTCPRRPVLHGMMAVEPTLLNGRLATAWRTVVWVVGWDRNAPKNNPGYLRALLGSRL